MLVLKFKLHNYFFFFLNNENLYNFSFFLNFRTKLKEQKLNYKVKNLHKNASILFQFFFFCLMFSEHDNDLFRKIVRWYFYFRLI